MTIEFLLIWLQIYSFFLKKHDANGVFSSVFCIFAEKL